MYGLMFVLAWGLMLPQVLYTWGLFPFEIPAVAGFLTGWAPAIAAITVSAIIGGRAAVGGLLGRFLIWRVSPVWYAVALLALAAFILGGIGLHVVTGGAMPAIPAAGAPASDILMAFVLTVGLGFLFNTEEIAWRGFALPRLQARHSALAATVLLAIPEALLHVPYFFENGQSFYTQIGPVWFTAFTVALVVMYTWVFNSTRGSLLIVTLLHASQNAWANLLSDNSARPFHFTVALIAAAAVALVLVYGARRLSRSAKVTVVQ
jgi:membrane protease YdiL (CAAX protease family)